jgi:hypothetical protein
MESYVAWVKENPLLSAVIQFGILGTLGEIFSCFFRARKLALSWSLRQWSGKILAWAVLGIVIKYGFVGMRGFVAGLAGHDFIPEWLATGFGGAFMLSVMTNTFFGPQMMAFHRLEDNLIAREWNWSGLTKAWWTLVWFWIPAHTLTFSLPPEYQIGLAAVWSVALGIILGWTSGKH